MEKKKGDKFELGRITSKQSLVSAMYPETFASSLERHRQGLWGDIEDEAVDMNERLVSYGARIMSHHRTSWGDGFIWITFADAWVTDLIMEPWDGV